MAIPLRESDLIFPSAATDFSIKQTSKALKRDNLSISNRLQSIAQDAAFVLRVADAFLLPLIANERCGSWYIPPDRKAGSAYFKSTDGHHGQWSFSLRRLNLQILDVLARTESWHGCIVVDSTRRGKSMPDALSKTIPIWIAVLNRLLFPANQEAHMLVTPEDVVSRSEHAQISDRLDSFVESLRSLHLDIEGLRDKLHSKPLAPVWVTPDTNLPDEPPEQTEFNLVVLCTASGRTSSVDHGLLTYVQGAADDSESWALGLDAASFWANSRQLLSTAEHELPELIQSICDSRGDAAPRELTQIMPSTSVHISNNAAAEVHCKDFDIVMSCADTPSDTIEAQLKQRYIHLACAAGKLGSRKLRAELPKLEDWRVVCDGQSDSKVLFTCESGRDFAVGAALAFICQYCSEEGRLLSSAQDRPITKTTIKHCLSWIMVSMPDASPSRATLQSVNAYLLG